MTKEYMSTQRYKAFYWDGSNVEALKEWLKSIRFGCDVEVRHVSSDGEFQIVGTYEGEDCSYFREVLLDSDDQWLVVSLAALKWFASSGNVVWSNVRQIVVRTPWQFENEFEEVSE